MVNRIDPEDVLDLRLRAADGRPSDISRARLALRLLGEEPETVEVGELPVDNGRIRADLGGIELRDGTWEVLWIDPDGAEVPVRTSDPGFSLAEREAYIARPRERDLRVLRSPDGRLRVRAAAVKPHAEVQWVDVEATEVRLAGVLAYAALGEGRHEARLVARQRGLSGVSEIPTEVEGAAFDVRMALEPLVEAHDFARKHNEWDLWLAVPALDAELRLASHADDVVGKKNRVRFPRTLLDKGERKVAIRPYYTIYDGLSLLAKDGGTASEGDR
ncbi:hypothetical protein GCM10027294_20840 [Marinactinospora endophytica]